MDEDMRRLLLETIVKLHPDEYAIVYIDPTEAGEARELFAHSSPFVSLTLTGEEASIVLRTSDWERLRGRVHSAKMAAPYRLITFDIVLDLSIVGFLAVVSAALAKEGVSIYAMSTYLKDHILVKTGDAEKAVSILDSLVDEAKRSQPING